MKQIVLILFLFPTISGAEEATDSQYATEEKVESLSEQCSKFLEAYRQSTVPLAKERVDDFRKKNLRFSGDPRSCKSSSLSCVRQMDKELKEAEEFQNKYLQYRLEMGMTLKRSRRGGDRGFQFPTQFKTSVGVPVFTGELSSKMRKKIMKRFNKQQAKYYSGWLKKKASSKYKNWNKCVVTNSEGQLQMNVLSSRSGHQAPKFKDLTSLSENLQKECQGLQSFVRKNRSSDYILKKFKENRQKKWQAFIAHRKKQKKKFPEWVDYADKRLGGIKDKKKRAMLVADTYNKMGEKLRPYTRKNYTDHELWTAINSADGLHSTLKKNCPEAPSRETLELIGVGIQMVAPGGEMVDRVKSESHNEMMALMGIKSAEEADEDWNTLHNQSVAGVALGFVPGGKFLGVAAKAAGKVTTQTAKRMAPKATERFQGTVFRTLAKGRIKVNKKVTAATQRVLQELEKKGVAVDKVDDWAFDKAAGVATGTTVETADEALENTAVKEYVNTMFAKGKRIRPLGSVEKKILLESSKDK